MTSRNAGTARIGGEFPENKRNEHDEERGVDWDEKAEDYAVAHFTNEHRPTLENINGYRRFAAAARWQRDQLRTDEAVERVARYLEPIASSPETARLAAREVITALLGEDK